MVTIEALTRQSHKHLTCSDVARIRADLRHPTRTIAPQRAAAEL
jgi:hypothetical protein